MVTSSLDNVENNHNTGRNLISLETTNEETSLSSKDGSSRNIESSTDSYTFPTYDFTIPKKIFGTKTLGPIIYGEFAPVSNWRLPGALYMGSKSLCFYGRFFRIDRKVIMPYSDIADISRVVMGSEKKNAIRVTMIKGEENVFDFGSAADDGLVLGEDSVEDLDEVVNLLLDLRQRALVGFVVKEEEGGDDEEETEAPIPKVSHVAGHEASSVKSLKSSMLYSPHPAKMMMRTLSDPLPVKENEVSGSGDSTDKDVNVVEKHVRIAGVDGYDVGFNTSSKGNHPHQHRPSVALAAVAAMADFRSFSVVIRHEEEAGGSGKDGKRKDDVNGSDPDGVPKSIREIIESGSLEEAERDGGMKDDDDDNDDKENDVESELDLEPFPNNFENAWDEIKRLTVPSFKESGLDGLCLPSFNLDTFFSTFLADDAPNSVARYQESLGDSELESSPWRKILLNEGNFFTSIRTIRYRHPVNAPMAPPSARARKVQRMRRYGSHGIFVETSTLVDDVPMADCFRVVDRILVEPQFAPSSANAKQYDENEKQKNCGVTVSARFEIRFVKSTNFRRIIELTTRGEIKKWFRGYERMILDAKDAIEGAGSRDRAVQTKEAAVPSKPSPVVETMEPKANFLSAIVGACSRFTDALTPLLSPPVHEVKSRSDDSGSFWVPMVFSLLVFLILSNVILLLRVAALSSAVSEMRDANAGAMTRLGSDVMELRHTLLASLKDGSDSVPLRVSCNAEA